MSALVINKAATRRCTWRCQRAPSQWSTCRRVLNERARGGRKAVEPSEARRRKSEVLTPAAVEASPQSAARPLPPES
eukprot:2809930-Pleurochrysis_carterae.AAC.3